MKNKTTRFLLALLSTVLISPLSGQNKANDSILYRRAIKSAIQPRQHGFI